MRMVMEMMMMMMVMEMMSRERHLTGRHPMVKSLASSKNVSNKDSKSWNTKYQMQSTNYKWMTPLTFSKNMFESNKKDVICFRFEHMFFKGLEYTIRVYPGSEIIKEIKNIFISSKFAISLTSGPAWCSGWNWTEKKGRLGKDLTSNIFLHCDVWVTISGEEWFMIWFLIYVKLGWCDVDICWLKVYIHLAWTSPSFDLSFSLMKSSCQSNGSSDPLTA